MGRNEEQNTDSIACRDPRVQDTTDEAWKCQIKIDYGTEEVNSHRDESRENGNNRLNQEH